MHVPGFRHPPGARRPGGRREAGRAPARKVKDSGLASAVPWNVIPIPIPAGASPLDDANVACSSAIVMVPTRVKLPAGPATVPTPGTFTCSEPSGDTLTMVSAPTWRTAACAVPVAAGAGPARRTGTAAGTRHHHRDNAPGCQRRVQSACPHAHPPWKAPPGGVRVDAGSTARIDIPPQTPSDCVRGMGRGRLRPPRDLDRGRCHCLTGSAGVAGGAATVVRSGSSLISRARTRAAAITAAATRNAMSSAVVKP